MQFPAFCPELWNVCVWNQSEHDHTFKTKEERKRKKKRDSSGDCLVSCLNFHLSGRCTFSGSQKVVYFFPEKLWFLFSLSAWQSIFLSRVCLVLWFTLYDNYTSVVVCLHLFYVISCTVVIKSGAFTGTSVIFVDCITFSHGGLFPAHFIFCAY